MPSPFPGMDPYLEAPGLWSAAHPLLIGGIVRMLNPLLPAAYFAKPGERIYVVEDSRSIFPDAAIVRHRDESSTARTAVLDSDPPLVLTAEPIEVRDGYVEIVRTDGAGRVIACIEVLSPRNKTRGHAGRDLYLRKQQEVLASRSHLVEIDLLRQGPHTVAAPEEQLARHGSWHYVVSLHRAGEEDRFEAWAMTIRDRLPRIHIPLEEPDTAVVLDLQQLLATCYQEGAFDRQIDYHADPPPPPFLRAEQEWIFEILDGVRQ